MYPRAPHAALLLFLLLTLVLSLVVGDHKESAYEKFQRQHVDEDSPSPYDDAYCTQRMQAKNMTQRTCKIINTFIHAALPSIDDICTGAGNNTHDNYYYSYSDFNVTDCTFVSRSSPKECMYSARNNTQKICIACTENLPVHYGPVSQCKP
ncbi:ribonuclease [Alligator mississippiensis]|nr:ribonuclease [Alligator mississippiensis]